jgi:hypothetical protein
MRGEVSEFGTNRPVVGAAVVIEWRGWGRDASGGVVWDKDDGTGTRTSADGRFDVVYRGPSSAQVTVRAEGFQPVTRWYGVDENVSVRLKRRDPEYRALTTGILALGEATNPSTGHAFGGWSFATSIETGDSAQADLLVDNATFSPRPRLVVRARDAGGVRFVSAVELGVTDALLVYTDSAPADGYARIATLEPGARPGVLFVRTRDGAHYAKVEVSPNVMMQQAPNGGRRAASFRYVYNAAGGRDVRFQEP